MEDALRETAFADFLRTLQTERMIRRLCMIKRFLAVIMILSLAASICGCSGKNDASVISESREEISTDVKSQDQADPGKADESADNGTDDGDREETAGSSGDGNTDGQSGSDQTARTAAEIVSSMTVGWNLGNTMDSFGKGNSLAAETYWSNPVTTQEIIDAVHDQGFNTIRVPVTWAEHLGPAPDYKIDEKWLERVAEIVDYCMNDDMFVILNTHHETEFWLKVNGDQEALCSELSAIWKQIAERFKDYGDNLIFEGMNEPRTKGTPQEWNGGTYEERKTVDAMNQAFYKTVRESGGNNATRSLMLCGYGHSPNSAALTAITIPEDDPYIIVAVHAYTPYFFTYEASGGYSVWDSSNISDIKSLASDLNPCCDHGIRKR